MWYGRELFETLTGDLATPGSSERLEKIACPIAGYFGNLDTHPTPEEVDKLDSRLTELGKEHEFHRYPDAGHAFLNEYHPRYHQDAAEESWNKGLEFLDARLG